jgi:hypothetical protein
MVRTLNLTYGFRMSDHCSPVGSECGPLAGAAATGLAKWKRRIRETGLPAFTKLDTNMKIRRGLLGVETGKAAYSTRSHGVTPFIS